MNVFSFFGGGRTPTRRGGPFIMGTCLSKGMMPVRRMGSRIFSSGTLNSKLTVRPRRGIVITPYSTAMSILVRNSERTIKLALTGKMRVLVRRKVSAIGVRNSKFRCFMGRKSGMDTKSGLLSFSPRGVGRRKCRGAYVLMIAGKSSCPSVGLRAKVSTMRNRAIVTRFWC